MKTCRVCLIDKPLEEFHRSGQSPDGRQYRCKPCASAAARQWAKDHPERYQETQRRYHQTDHYRERRRAYRAANAEKVRAQRRASYQRHREEIRERDNAKRRTPEFREAKREQYARRRALDPRFVHKEAIWALYGLTLDEYDAMVLRQEGRCAICNDPMREPQVDHCHTGGHVRALLCHLCNRGLGLFRDNPEYLAAAIEFLRAHAPD